MAKEGKLPELLRGVFDEGLDEVLIFAIIFIFVLFSGYGNSEEGCNSIIPIIIIVAFLILFAGVSRNNDGKSDTTANRYSIT
jgi:hypothetical protein